MNRLIEEQWQEYLQLNFSQHVNEKRTLAGLRSVFFSGAATVISLLIDTKGREPGETAEALDYEIKEFIERSVMKMQ